MDLAALARNAGTARKGQWFIISGLLLSTIVLGAALSKSQVRLGETREPFEKYIFENAESKGADAVNAILAENATSGNIESRLKDYLLFLKNFGNSRGINISSYFVVGLPLETGGMNVTVVNFANTLSNISLSANGSTQNIQEIPANSASTVSFSSVPGYFLFNYTFFDEESQETQADSFNLTKRVFAVVKTRVETKDGNQVWQDVKMF